MKRREEIKKAAVEFAQKGDLGSSYHHLYDGFIAGVHWSDQHPIGVLDEDFCWAVYNYINEWKAGNFGEVPLQKALRTHPLDY